MTKNLEHSSRLGHEGPWEVIEFLDLAPAYNRHTDKYHKIYAIFGVTPDQPLICQVEAWGEDGKADALMLAAAPGLYSVLERLSKEAATSVEYSDWPELQELLEEADNILAKAKKGKVKRVKQYENT